MKIKNLIMLMTIFTLTAAIIGCGRPEIYGEQISNRAITPIKDILLHPEEYDGKAVSVKGKISTECSTGCWFDLKEGGAIIYVDIEPSGLAIPPRVGRSVTIEGTITVKNGKPTLTGKGVKIQ